MIFIQLCKSQSRLQLSHNRDFWFSLSWFVLSLIASVQKALPNHPGVVGCSVLISARLRDYCHLAFRCILPPPTLPLLFLVFSFSCRIIICVVSIMKKRVIFLYYYFFFSTGFTDNQHRWKPGIRGCSGMVPDRHVQPVPVWPTRCLLLHPAGECPEHKATRRECPDRYSGGRLFCLPMSVVWMEI